MDEPCVCLGKPNVGSCDGLLNNGLGLFARVSKKVGSFLVSGAFTGEDTKPNKEPLLFMPAKRAF